jgi:hypothetical protein
VLLETILNRKNIIRMPNIAETIEEAFCPEDPKTFSRPSGREDEKNPASMAITIAERRM